MHSTSDDDRNGDTRDDKKSGWKRGDWCWGDAAASNRHTTTTTTSNSSSSNNSSSAVPTNLDHSGAAAARSPRMSFLPATTESLSYATNDSPSATTFVPSPVAVKSECLQQRQTEQPTIRIKMEPPDDRNSNNVSNNVVSSTTTNTNTNTNTNATGSVVPSPVAVKSE